MFVVRQSPRLDQAGFAYLWVLMFVALMGLSLTIAAEVDSTASQRDREKALLSIGREFREAIGRYHALRLGGEKGAYPKSLEDLLLDPRAPGTVRHLRKIYVDPMTGKAEWGLVMVAGRLVGVHSLSEKKPIKQAGFEVADQSFENSTRYSEWLFTYPSDLTFSSDLANTTRVQGTDGSLLSREETSNKLGDASLF